MLKVDTNLFDGVIRSKTFRQILEIPTHLLSVSIYSKTKDSQRGAIFDLLVFDTNAAAENGPN